MGWHECGEPLDESQRIEGDGGCAVAPVAFEAVDDSAVGRETLRRDGWAGDVATEMFESLELAGGHEHLGVQGEAVAVGAQGSGQRWRARRAALAEARDGPRGLRRERGAALDRRGAELIEERRLLLGRLVTVDGSVRTRQAALALEVARDAPGELLDQRGDLGIGERRGGLEARREARARRDEGAVEQAA